MLNASLAFLALNAPQAPNADPNVYVPPSSIARASDAGRVAHTSHLVLDGPWQGTPGQMQPKATPSGFSPASIRSAYSLNVTNASGAGTAIAIVDAYHYKNAVRDFNVFSTQFGLPLETGNGAVLQLVYQGSSAPAVNVGWNQEEALDIEWAHAMAPGAKIYLVEANSATLTNLLACVTKASNLPNVRAVSMSWASGEFSGETGYDTYFAKPNVVYFASSGDTGGAIEWPAMSKNVVSVGGTSLRNSGGWLESAWSGTGGGLSRFYGIPAYQSGFPGVTGTGRNGPDVSAVADPNTGCAVYAPTSTLRSGWMVFGGTSLSSPIVASIYTLSGHVSSTSFNEHGTIYANYALFNDIVGGQAGSNPCVIGFDRCTGVGSPHGTAGF